MNTTVTNALVGIGLAIVVLLLLFVVVFLSNLVRALRRTDADAP